MSRYCAWSYRSAVAYLTDLRAIVNGLAGPLRNGEHEAIHDVRVASRRMRVALREHRSLFWEEAVARVRGQLHTVTRLLGQPRELDVCLKMLSEHNEEEGMRAREAFAGFLSERRKDCATAVTEAADIIASIRFRHDFDRVLRSRGEAKRCMLDDALKRISRRYEAVTGEHQLFSAAPSEQALHALRVSLKKFRYVCEVFREPYGKPMDAYLKELKGLQDALGNWHDLAVLADYLRCAIEQSNPGRKHGWPGLFDELVNNKRAAYANALDQMAQLFGAAQTRLGAVLLGKSDVDCDLCDAPGPRGAK